ncbi:hypothetical protein N0V88_006589 [Collariella sp. IMI 366227]|nr:hypothetical protein N0V88_006589 [Collariella sp. IMI 366227]
MATNIAAHLATQSPDHTVAKVLGHKYWNHFAIQLGHWNSMKVIIMDDEMFRIIPILVKIEIAREMTSVQLPMVVLPPPQTSAHNRASKFLNEDVMFARDADNAKVWILGPRKLIGPNVTVVGNTPIWDPKKKHVPPPQMKISRPPNAYILYRKDKHNEVKFQNPNIQNNEISVITGAMWKRETTEAFEHNPHQSAQVNNDKAGIQPNSDITRRIPAAQRFLPPAVEPGWTPDHLLPHAPTEPTYELFLELDTDIDRILADL